MRDREKLLTDDEWGQIYQRECRAEDELSRIANQFTHICATNGNLHQNQNYVKAFREIRKHLAAFAQSCVERRNDDTELLDWLIFYAGRICVHDSAETVSVEWYDSDGDERETPILDCSAREAVKKAMEINGQ